jgi:hypothetical protein
MATIKTFRRCEPACRFGPGGQYVRPWPGEARGAADGLRALLTSIAEIGAVLLGSEPGSAEDTAAVNDRYPAYPRKAAAAGYLFGAEAAPLSLHRRTGEQSRHRPKHAPRVHRKTSKGSTSSRQKLLFEIDFSRAKTA